MCIHGTKYVSSEICIHDAQGQFCQVDASGWCVSMMPWDDDPGRRITMILFAHENVRKTRYLAFLSDLPPGAVVPLPPDPLIFLSFFLFHNMH
jgi:hypothetical protein